MLTIVVPVLNRAMLVVRTLDSIAASASRAFQLIIVDNGSTDGTLEVCQQWAREHAPSGLSARVLEAARPGASAARNVGLAACTTEFVYFFDSDDLFSSHFVAAIENQLSSSAPWDMLYVPVRQAVGGKEGVRPFCKTTHPKAHILNSQFNTLSMVFRTSFLKRIGGWNETLKVWVDWELGLRAMLFAPRLKWQVEQPFHHVQVHAASLTGSSLSATLEPALCTMHVALDELLESPLNEDCRRASLRAFFLRCRIMEGHLEREECHAGKVAYRQLAAEVLRLMPGARPTLFLRLGGSLLERYTSLGGRGAWRMALQLA